MVSGCTDLNFQIAPNQCPKVGLIEEAHINEWLQETGVIIYSANFL